MHRQPIKYSLCQRAFGAVGARFLHTEEVAGSNPVTPTIQNPQVRGIKIASDLLFCWEGVSLESEKTLCYPMQRLSSFCHIFVKFCQF